VQTSFDVRRLHDLDLSGHAIWIGLIVYALASFAAPGSAPLLDLMGRWGWRVLLMLVPGTKRDNEFGPTLRGPS
jgi:uncharacterized membrane protein YhaH (DUF805 family)